MARKNRKRMIEGIVSALKAYDPERVYLFGSWARGEADRLSDIDLVIVKDTQAGFFHRLQEAAACLPEDWGPVDVLVYTPDELRRMEEEGNAFVEMLLEEGVLIYEK